MASQQCSSLAVDLEKDDEVLSIHSHNSTDQHDTKSHYQGINTKAVGVEVSLDGDEGSRMDETPVAVTRTSTRSSWKDPGPPPDGGLTAWTQCAMGHLTITNTWGFINSFGVFQTYYVTALGRPDSDIAWIGSIQVFLLFFIGTFSGRLTDAGYFRHVFLAGSILLVFGVFMASLCTQYWQLFLAQGICVGIGNGCLFTPMLSVLSTYFSKKRSLAIGMSACGSVTGGLIYPVMVQQLLPTVGFGWTMRAVGFVQLACLIVVNLCVRQRTPPRRTGSIVEWAAFKEARYVFFAAGMFFVFWGLYFAYFYLGSFGRSAIGIDYTESVTIILVLNGSGLLGRLLPNYLADKYFGPLNVMLPVAISSSVIMYCMAAVQNRAGLYIWAVIYGTFGAAIQSLFPAVLSSLTTDLRKAGIRMGMIFTIVSFAVLTGPPIAGVLIKERDGNYLYAELFAGTSILIGFALMVAARIAKSGFVLRSRM